MVKLEGEPTLPLVLQTASPACLNIAYCPAQAVGAQYMHVEVSPLFLLTYTQPMAYAQKDMMWTLLLQVQHVQHQCK